MGQSFQDNRNLNAALARIARLRQALGWYAQEADWKSQGYSYDTDYGREWDASPPAIYADEGKVARAALLLDSHGPDDEVTDADVAALDVLDDAGLIPAGPPMTPEKQERFAAKLREMLARVRAERAQEGVG